MKNLKEQASGRILEAKKDESGKVSFPVVIIAQGLGNLADKNYYSKEAILSAPSVYEGKKVYFDHPTSTQASEQPGRSVRETCGHYENVKAVQGENGLYELRADLVPEKDSPVISKIQHAVEYKKKYPDQDYIGISINGDGEGKTLEYEDFLKEAKPTAFEMEKISKVEGSPINYITKLTSAVSADLVTEAGARGRFLKESEKVLKKQRRQKMFEAMRKFLFGAETGDKKMLEAAVKDMLQSEGGEDEAKKKEAEAEEAALEAESESMAKAMLNCKKEMKKYEDESESEYEARCMKQAMKQMKQAKKKEEEDEEKKKEAQATEKKHEDEDEKKEGDKKDEPHDDEDQDKALIKKMMGQMDEMKKEIEGLKKSKKESEDEAKKHHESAVVAKVELEAKKFAEEVDMDLAKSGLSRAVTKELADLFISKKIKKDERRKIIETAKLASTKAIEEKFYGTQSTGFPEISSDSTTGSNDHLF